MREREKEALVPICTNTSPPALPPSPASRCSVPGFAHRRARTGRAPSSTHIGLALAGAALGGRPAEPLDTAPLPGARASPRPPRTACGLKGAGWLWAPVSPGFPGANQRIGHTEPLRNRGSELCHGHSVKCQGSAAPLGGLEGSRTRSRSHAFTHCPRTCGGRAGNPRPTRPQFGKSGRPARSGGSPERGGLGHSRCQVGRPARGTRSLSGLPAARPEPPSLMLRGSGMSGPPGLGGPRATPPASVGPSLQGEAWCVASDGPSDRLPRSDGHRGRDLHEVTSELVPSVGRAPAGSLRMACLSTCVPGTPAGRGGGPGKTAF